MSTAPTLPTVALGLVVMGVYWAWLWAFFTHLRPRAMKAVGSRLRVKVAESARVLDAGTFDIEEEEAPVRKHAAVTMADMVLTTAGTVGVAALWFVPVFLVADSGALLPVESRLTGRGVVLEPIADTPMSTSKPAAVVNLSLRNSGVQPLASCQARVADYRAADGYLDGRSPFFALAPDEARTVAVPLAAVRPPPGVHHYRIKVECANERLAQGGARLSVGP